MHFTHICTGWNIESFSEHVSLPLCTCVKKENLLYLPVYHTYIMTQVIEAVDSILAYHAKTLGLNHKYLQKKII